ncbi:MAG: hypothetical protein IT426_13685 [Pirellulales bacterium]|nr:hypothetical protein [Pirellulales bacterium]
MSELETIMQAANTLRHSVPKLVTDYLENLPDEADMGFEKDWYENLPREVNELFDDLMGLCQRFRLDRMTDVTGKPWRNLQDSDDTNFLSTDDEKWPLPPSTIPPQPQHPNRPTAAVNGGADRKH